MNATIVNPKNLLLSDNFEKFTSINLWVDQSQLFKRATVICPFIRLYRGAFLKVNGHQPNFRELLCLHSLSPL